MIVYYHGDIDGITAAGIIKTKYPDAKFILCQYGDDIKIDLNQKACILVDYCFESKTMDLLHQTYKENLIWIDHHITAKHKNPNIWENTKGLKDTDTAAALLTWKFFHKTPPPKSVLYAADVDMYRFEYKETESFALYFDSVITKLEEFDPDLLTDKTTKNYVESGKPLLQAQKTRVKKSFDQGHDINFYGYRTRIINTNHDTSKVGQYCYKNGYPVGLIYAVLKGVVHASMRSNTIDVSAIAKRHGGGGHKPAAGFEMPVQEFITLLKEQSIQKY